MIPQILHDGTVITLIHFEYNTQIACMPFLTELHWTPSHPSYQRTSEPRAVNCPACKQSVIFKEIMVRVNG